MNRVLVTYNDEIRRMGTLSATFVVTEKVFEIIKHLPEFTLHDILGKHSEVEVYPSNCQVILTETPELEETFDILQQYVQTGIASDFIDRANDPGYYYD